MRRRIKKCQCGYPYTDCDLVVVMLPRRPRLNRQQSHEARSGDLARDLVAALRQLPGGYIRWPQFCSIDIKNTIPTLF